MKTLKNFLVTCLMALAIALLFGAVRLLATIPVNVLWQLLKSNWIGIMVGVLLSHLAMFASTLGKRHHQEDDDDED